MNGEWFAVQEVPPPEKAPVDGVAAGLGLPDGLRAVQRDVYRCAACGEMQPSGSWMVWVPDGIRRGDPAWGVTEMARRGAFNGAASGWCVECCRSFIDRLTPPPPERWVQDDGFVHTNQRFNTRAPTPEDHQP